MLKSQLASALSLRLQRGLLHRKRGHRILSCWPCGRLDKMLLSSRLRSEGDRGWAGVSKLDACWDSVEYYNSSRELATRAVTATIPDWADN